MAEPPKPPDDDRIEDLLSQLQGIFGRLSTSEDEEAKGKIDVPPGKSAEPPAAEPAVSRPESPTPSAPSVPPPPAPEPTPEPPKPVPPVFVPPPVPEPAPPPPAPVAPPPQMVPIEIPPLPAEAAQASSAASDETPTAVFFPPGREADARSLADKLQSLTPKFTKVTFRLKVICQEPFDPKSEWKDQMLQRVEQQGIRTVFVVVDRPLEDAKRKALVAELESRVVYFHEVPLMAIEKKAFFTDLLLGLVFFFDSLRSQQPPAA